MTMTARRPHLATRWQRIAAQWPRLLAGGLGFLWFLQIGGAPTLDPLNVGWIPGSDWMQHWLGWLMFRHEPWTFPLGTLTSMPYPIGTTIGFTDSNPLVSLLLKPFSGLMPPEVQFIGPWLALCFVLQGYMGAALASTVTDDKGQQALGGYLFVLSPVLVARIGHDTLCAHWLLLFLLYLALRDPAPASMGDPASGDPARGSARGTWRATAAVMLAAAIHPYLMAMCWVLAQALYVRLWRARLVTATRAAIAALATTVGVLLVFGVIGYFGGGATMTSSGFGTFAADALALVDPERSSRLLQLVPQLNLPWEGFGYLGLGGLAACVVAIVVVVRTRPRLCPGTWAVVAAAVALGIYALSVDVRLAGRTVATLKRLYTPLAPLTGPFRASGRFIWPLHYLLLLFGVWGATRVAGAGRRAAATTVLAIVVIVQAADFRVDASWSADKQFRRAPTSTFALTKGNYDHLALYPMQVLGVCGDPYQEAHAYRYMLLAYQVGLTYNSGIYARVPAAKIAAECTRLQQVVDAGTLDARTIYVVSPTSVPLFTRAGAACGRFDGDWVCVSGDSDETFRTLVATGKVEKR